MSSFFTSVSLQNLIPLYLCAISGYLLEILNSDIKDLPYFEILFLGLKNKKEKIMNINNVNIIYIIYNNMNMTNENINNEI